MATLKLGNITLNFDPSDYEKPVETKKDNLNVVYCDQPSCFDSKEFLKSSTEVKEFFSKNTYIKPINKNDFLNDFLFELLFNSSAFDNGGLETFKKYAATNDFNNDIKTLHSVTLI